MIKEKSITRVFLWQTAGKFLLQGISFFTAPIFTRLLNPEDYGQFAFYSSWVSLSGLIIGFQTHGSIANAKIKYDQKEINAYLSSILSISLLSFFIMLSVSVFANKFLSNLLGLRQDLIILLVIQSFASFCISFYTGKLIQFKQVETSTLLSLLVSISSIALSLLFVINAQTDKGIAKIYANAIPAVIVGFILLIVVFWKGKTFYNSRYWSFCLRLTLPLILHGAGSLILSQSDRIMLKKWSGDGVVGIYSFSYTIALIIDILWMSFNTTWVPFYYEYKRKNDMHQIQVKTKNYITVFSILTIGFLLLVPEVYKILAPEKYWSGIPLIPLIALAYYFNFLYSFPANFEFYNEKTKLISIGTLCAAVINIVLNFILIPIFSGIGAALATVTSFIFLFLFHEFIARRIIKNYDYSFRIYLTGFIPVLFFSVLYYFTLEFWLFRWIGAFFLGVFLIHRIVKNKSIF